jgi:L-amino acid N-acyltransferase YncA
MPNEASAALHEKLGFKQGIWVDVAYWQLVR